MKNQTSTATVKEIFTWLTGDKAWQKSPFLCDAMLVDNVHAHDIGTKEVVERLSSLEEEIVEVKSIFQKDGDWKIEFHLDDKLYEFQACNCYGEID